MTNTINITATVAAKCTIGAFSVAFGAYDPFSATPLDQQGTVTINCTKGTSGTVSFDLGVNASGRTGDSNGRPDTYLYTANRKITLVQSVKKKAVPLNGGGMNPSMNFYANYVVFDSPAPMNAAEGPHQIFMRYLGPV